ncbi:MAG TPA: FAD-dependent oxidoreductase [Candidatus Limnocylindrales bacterium]
MSPEVRAFVGDSIPPEPAKPKRPARRKKSPALATAPSLETADDAAEAAADRVGEPTAPAEPTALPETEPAAELQPEPEPKPAPEPTPEPATEPEPAPTPAAEPAKPHVLIIGGGGTGGALAHDLTLRGLRVTLVERGEVTSGATGRHQGLLHSGARYATTDRAAAIECIAENKILRRIAPGSFEENDGLFVALTDEDADFATGFFEACWQCAVPTKRLDREAALRMEPGLNPELRFAIQVPDATMDAMRMPLRFFATARRNGADIRPFTEVVALTTAGQTVTGVKVHDHAAGRDYEIGADVVVNAAGPWAGLVAGLAGVQVAVTPSPGAMVAVRGRHCNMVVNRLHAPGDGDIILPQRGLTIMGTSSWVAGDPDDPTIPAGHVETIMRGSAALLPALASAEIRATWSAARPLAGLPPARRVGRVSRVGRAGAQPGRSQTRELHCFDHAADATPTQGFVTIAGGNATTLRAMAEAAADVVCAKLGVGEPCRTGETVLLPHTAWYVP